MELCSARRGIHKFEARYDEVPNKELLNSTSSLRTTDNSILILKIYVKDICINCGAEIKK